MPECGLGQSRICELPQKGKYLDEEITEFKGTGNTRWLVVAIRNPPPPMKSLIALQRVTKLEDNTTMFEMSFGYTVKLGAMGKFLGDTAVKSQLVKLGTGAGKSLEYFLQTGKKLGRKESGNAVKEVKKMNLNSPQPVTA